MIVGCIVLNIPDTSDISHLYILFRGQPQRYSEKIGSYNFVCIYIDIRNVADM